jgi:predicted transglutaminase-like cysteine proteinase
MEAPTAISTIAKNAIILTPSSSEPPAVFFTITAVLAALDNRRPRAIPGRIRLASVARVGAISDGAIAPFGAMRPLGAEPFGYFGFRAPQGPVWQNWHGIEADIAHDQIILESCERNLHHCPANAAQFLRLIDAVKLKSGRAQLDLANRSVNRAIRYVSDPTQNGVADHWSAPLETFATGRGDCEDYAIAKYVVLREAGFPLDNLRIVLLRGRLFQQDHAVLAARINDDWIVLDSLHTALLDDSDLASFLPVFAISHRSIYLLAAPYIGQLPVPLPPSGVAAAPRL